MNTLQLVLLLLGASVLVVTACRVANLPPILGYLLVGVVVGPHALDLLPDAEGASQLAEFGVVGLNAIDMALEHPARQRVDFKPLHHALFHEPHHVDPLRFVDLEGR